MDFLRARSCTPAKFRPPLGGGRGTYVWPAREKQVSDCAHNDRAKLNKKLELVLPILFARQACWILVGTFAEAAFQSCGQGDARLAKLVAQAIRG